MHIKPRYRFLLSNLWKGLIWFVALVIIFLIAKQLFGPTEDWMNSIHNQPVLVYSVFLVSEVVFGIIPPEIFMIWSIHGGISDSYIINVFFLSIISFSAGISGYLIGASMRELQFFLHVEEKYLKQYKKYLKRFGGILVITAALTPLPFSAVAMAVAAFRFPFKYYFIYSLSRFVRFGVYGYIVWQANAF